MPSQPAFAQLIETAGIRLVNSREIYPELRNSDGAGLPLLVVENALGHAVIALQGAHIMSFQATGQREMLWLSPKCLLEPGKPIRGGIPLCLPWFGPGPDGKTAHGFARTATWSLLSAEILDNDATRLVLALEGDTSTCDLWPHAFIFHLEVVVGSELHVGLTVENRSDEAAPLSFAFHTYFAVPNVAQVQVAGLDSLTFIDKTDNAKRKQQTGDVTIDSATDRIYLDVPARQTLKSAEGCVNIDSDSRCAVVWNIWTNDKTVADIGEGNHAGYLCVERGDMADHAVTVLPGSTYQTSMNISY